MCFTFLGHVHSKFMGTDVNINVMADSRGVVFKSTGVKSPQPRFFVPTRVMSCAHMKVWTFLPFSVSGHRHGHEALKGMVGSIIT